MVFGGCSRSGTTDGLGMVISSGGAGGGFVGGVSSASVSKTRCSGKMKLRLAPMLQGTLSEQNGTAGVGKDESLKVAEMADSVVIQSVERWWMGVKLGGGRVAEMEESVETQVEMVCRQNC